MTQEELANFRELGKFLLPKYNQWNLPDPFWGSEQEWVCFEEHRRLDYFVRTWDGSPVVGWVYPARQGSKPILGSARLERHDTRAAPAGALLIDAYVAKYPAPSPCEYGPNLLK